MINTKICRAISIIVSAVIVIGMLPTAAFAESESPNYTKTQVVYSKLDGNGKQSGVYVVNQFEVNSNNSASVTDYGDYTSIKNITDEQNIAVIGKKEIEINSENPYLYQGNLGEETQLPWNVSVSFILDGKDVSVSELAGKSGDLRLEFDVSANENCTKDYANNYLLQVTADLDNEKCSDIKCEDATIAQDSGNTKLSFMVFPGRNAKYEITAKVKDFEFDGFTVVGIPLAIDLDVDDSEFDEATTQFDELENAIKKICDGTQSLKNGTSALQGGIKNVYSGQLKLNDGIQDLSSATSDLSAGAKQINDALQTFVSLGNQLRSGVDSYSGSLQAKSDELSSQSASIDVESASSAYKSAMTEYVGTFAVAFAQAYAQTGSQEQAQQIATEATATQYTNLENSLTAFITAQASKSSLSAASEALNEALSGFSELKTGITSYVSAISELAEATESLDSGAGSFESSMGQLSSGSSELTSGTGNLVAGGDKLDSGAIELTNGTSSLADATAGMSDTLIEAVKERLTEFLNPEFKMTDFVSGASENISSVQFVYKTESITVNKDNPITENKEDNMSFIQKLLALFGIE